MDTERDRMEQNLYSDDLETNSDYVLASIAISLKRIADSLEKANLNGDLIANSIEGAIFRGMQGK